MARKKGGKKPYKKKSEDLNKAESVGPVPTSTMVSEKGQPRIVTSSNFIQDEKNKELAMPQRLCTFDNMYKDDAVYKSIFYTNLHTVKALHDGEFRGKTAKAKKAAEFLNYCIRNMSHGTWWDFCNNAVTDIQYGYSLLNIVTEKRTYGQFAGARVIKKLSPRDQKSVYGWLWDKDNREVLGFVQKPMLVNSRSFNMRDWENGINALSVGKWYKADYPAIRKQQLLWFTYNSTNNNPQGNSPLIHCYADWREKDLIRKYETVGVSKDMAGVPVLRVPSELIDRAKDPTNYPADAQALTTLKQNTQSLHAGESTYMILSSDVDETTRTSLYDIQFLGIQGQGKQFDIGDIITRKNRAIYNTFGTEFLLLGQESVGSYALSTTSSSTHAHFVERNVCEKKVVIDNQLIPRILKANDIELDWKDMPEFVPADPTQLDLDIVGKFIQRAKSVGGLTKEATEFVYEKAGLPTEGIDALMFDDKGQSRSGESAGSSGTGSTQEGGVTSSTNMDNKSAIKNLQLIDVYKDQIVVFDKDSNETHFLPREDFEEDSE